MMVSLPSLIGLALLMLVLSWQLWRSRLDWRWRWLWLPVVLGLMLAVLPPTMPRSQREVVVLTPGDAQTPQHAMQWAKENDAELLSLPTLLDLAELQQLRLSLASDGGKRVHLFGYGFGQSVWAELPAQTVIWHPAELPTWQLQAERELQLGDVLSLQLRAPAEAQVLQVLDSRQQLQVEATFQAGRAELTLRPAAVGQYDWLLRVRNVAGETLRDIPLAFSVTAPTALVISGQFAAPSFEQRALRDWWQQTGMRGEFVTRTGQQVQRRDRFNLEVGANTKSVLELRDLRSWLQSSEAERRAILHRVSEGGSLLLLSDGSESEQAARQQLGKQLAITWQALSDVEQQLTVADVALQRASWLPAANGAWQAPRERAVLHRSWQQGQIIWMGVQNSHRLWQRARPAYASWWQQALQLSTLTAARLHVPEYGVRGEPSLICADEFVASDSNDATTPVQLALLTPDGESLSLRLQASPFPARRCALYTPTQTGWYQFAAPFAGAWRVFDEAVMPEQRWHEAYAATRQHTQELAAPLPLTRQTLPRWPFLLLSVVAMALIWWRERQLAPASA